MPRPKKTVRVEELLDFANNILERSADRSEVRPGVMTFIEDILLRTDQYNGYRLLKQEELLPSTRDARTADDTRRRYSMKTGECYA